MFRALPVLVLMVWSAAPAAAADEPKRSTAEQIVTTLHEEKFSYEKDLKTTPFQEVLDDLEKRYKVKFIITAKFEDGVQVAQLKAANLNTKDLDGVILHSFLKAYLAALPSEGLTYLVRPDYIEIATKEAAQEEAGLTEEAGDGTGFGGIAGYRPNLPLICVAAKEKQLSAVLDELRRVYGANIVVESGAKAQLKTVITEQLLNVPVDTALELLAGQADLGVVRKGNTFRIISNPKG